MLLAVVLPNCGTEDYVQNLTLALHVSEATEPFSGLIRGFLKTVFFKRLILRKAQLLSDLSPIYWSHFSASVIDLENTICH